MDGLCVSYVGCVPFYIIPSMSNKIFYSILLRYTLSMFYNFQKIFKANLLFFNFFYSTTNPY